MPQHSAGKIIEPMGIQIGLKSVQPLNQFAANGRRGITLINDGRPSTLFMPPVRLVFIKPYSLLSKLRRVIRDTPTPR